MRTNDLGLPSSKYVSDEHRMQIYLKSTAGGGGDMKEFHDWNRRVLEALEQTFTYDAKLMSFFVQEGERQNQLYAERLAEFRKKVESEKASIGYAATR